MYAPRGHRRGRQLLQSEWYLFGSAIFVATVRTTVGAPAADCVRPTAAVACGPAQRCARCVDTSVSLASDVLTF